MGVDRFLTPVVVIVSSLLICWFDIWRLSLIATGFRRVKRRRLEYAAIGLTLPLAVAITAVCLFNAYRVALFQPKSAIPGKIYVVDGYNMHLDCIGEGLPTLVLESGLGSDWEIWKKVQPTLANTTRVCSYDRAGYAYSDPRPGPRDADHITEELHSLLLRAKVTGPIVMMGHSLGGLFIRDYAARFPKEVAGLILIDAVTPSWALGYVDAPPPWVTKLGISAACATNIRRLVGSCIWPRLGAAKPWQIILDGACDPRFCATKQESRNFISTGEETEKAEFYKVPILIISHDPAKTNAPRVWEDAWSLMQEHEKQLSSRARRVIAKDSTHFIQLDRPDLIEIEAARFLQEIRDENLSGDNLGTTTVK
jgi:pimeloyl-ACP methyl ester carboxylesterase